MSNRIELFVAALDDETIFQIIKDWDVFSTEGFIDACTLRSKAEELQEQLGAKETSVAMWMKELTFECCRALASRVMVAHLQAQGLLTNLTKF